MPTLPAIILGLSLVSPMVAIAADNPPAVPLTVMVKRIYTDEQYHRDNPSKDATAAMAADAANTGSIMLVLEVKAAPGWTLMQADDVTATTTMDTGEVIRLAALNPSYPAHSARRMALESLGREPQPMQFYLRLDGPVHPSARIAALDGSLRAVVSDDARMQRLHLVPSETEQSIVGIPGCDLTFHMSTEGAPRGYPAGSMWLFLHFTEPAFVQEFAVVDAAGKPLALGGSQSRGGKDAKDENVCFRDGAVPAAIDLAVCGHVQAARMAFTLANLPLVGRADDAATVTSATRAETVDLPPPFDATSAAVVRVEGAAASATAAHPATAAAHADGPPDNF